MNMRRLLSTASSPFLFCRVAVGLVFLSEGIQKFIRPEEIGSGRFAKIGFSSPDFWAHFAGSFEILCGLLVLIGLFTRFAVIPLLIIMITALITTKLTVLIMKGFWPFTHEYRTDFVMTVLLTMLLIYGAGARSVDSRIIQKIYKLPDRHEN